MLVSVSDKEHGQNVTLQRTTVHIIIKHARRKAIKESLIRDDHPLPGLDTRMHSAGPSTEAAHEGSEV